MRKMLLSLMLCFSMLFTAVVPAFASEVTPADAESKITDSQYKPDRFGNLRVAGLLYRSVFQFCI